MKTINYNKAALKLELFVFESEMSRRANELERMVATAKKTKKQN